MKLWIYAGLISLAMASTAHAAETTTACEVDDTQRTANQRVDTSAVFPVQGRGSCATRRQRFVERHHHDRAACNAAPRNRTGCFLAQRAATAP